LMVCAVSIVLSLKNRWSSLSEITIVDSTWCELDSASTLASYVRYRT
jgi:hypothetical protein